VWLAPTRSTKPERGSANMYTVHTSTNTLGAIKAVLDDHDRPALERDCHPRHIYDAMFRPCSPSYGIVAVDSGARNTNGCIDTKRQVWME
jgi:hypothetical protein